MLLVERCGPGGQLWGVADEEVAGLELDRERMRRWAVVHALAWVLGDDERFDAIPQTAVWLDRA